MGVPVEIPGLSTIIPELPPGLLVVVESAGDPAKSYFVRRLCRTAHRQGQPVTFLTSRDREELVVLLKNGDGSEGDAPAIQIIARDAVESLDEYATQGGLLAVDSFSFLTLDLSPVRLAALLRDLMALCRRHGMGVLLGTDRGMFEARSEAITIHLADGFVQFHTKEGPEGIVRFLRIPKWIGGRFFDRNIYYEYDGEKMAIDLRKRVI
jgi:hypothetical protein